ncbi:MAG: hypothetical protein ACRDTA_14695 [Pseudonocardiaceae bacterium]
MSKGKHRRPSLRERLTRRRPRLALQPPAPLEWVDLRTSITHLLTPDAAAAGRVRAGRYIALCGAEVIPAGVTRARPWPLRDVPHRDPRSEIAEHPPMIYAVKCKNCPYANRYVDMSTAHDRAGNHARRLRHRIAVTDGQRDTVHDHRHDQTSRGVSLP